MDVIFSSFPSPILSGRMQLGCLPYFHTRCGLSANLECRSEVCCMWLTENTVCKNLPSVQHCTTSGYIFATKACIDNRKKLLSSNMSSRCPHNIVDFSPLAAEIGLPVWGTQLISTASRLGSITARQSSSEHQPNFAALNLSLIHISEPTRPY